jgi:hypothetical protein
MSGRIVLHLDRGLGWTKPLAVACCGLCGAELARHLNPDRALRAARRTRCPACGTRCARRLPGTTSPATDLALAQSRRELARRRRWPQLVTRSRRTEGSESPACLPPRPG